MLQVTQTALVLLRDALVQERNDESQVFRLITEGGDYVLGIGDIETNDIQYDAEGETVLAAPSAIANDELGDATIDLQTTPEGPKLVMVGPAT